MTRRATIPALFTALVALLTVAPEAQAYLDPSTGSMVVSALVGIFATVSLGIKTYWYRLKALFRRPSAPGPNPGATAEPPATGPDQARDGGGRS